MAKDKLPYFKWYPKDFDQNEKVRLMNLEEIGLYALCLNHSWVNGSLPADLDEIGRAMKVPPKQFRRAWPRVAPCFVKVENRLVNPRQEEERKKAIEKSGKCTEAIRIRHSRNTSVDQDVLPRALAHPESESESDSSGKVNPDGFLANYTPQQLAAELWKIHPSPSKIGFVEASLFNEMNKSTKPPEKFAESIIASLEQWAEYWRESGRMATGLDNWISSGDFTVAPPPVTSKANRRSLMEGV